MLYEKDLITNIEWVLYAAPITRLKGTEFQKSEINLVTQVDEYYKNIGGKVEREDLGIIKLTRRGIRASIAHGVGRSKSVAFAAVPDVIKSGRIIDYQYNWKGRGYDTYIIDAPILIGDIEYIVEVIINKDKDGQRFYLHEVEIKEKAQSAFKTGMVTSALQTSQKTRSAFKTATERSAPQVSKLIIIQKLKEINNKGEKK